MTETETTINKRGSHTTENARFSCAWVISKGELQSLSAQVYTKDETGEFTNYAGRMSKSNGQIEAQINEPTLFTALATDFIEMVAEVEDGI